MERREEPDHVGEYLSEVFKQTTAPLPESLQAKFSKRYEKFEANPCDGSLGAKKYFKHLLSEKVDSLRREFVEQAYKSGTLSQAFHEVVDFDTLVSFAGDAYALAFQEEDFVQQQKMIGIFVNSDYLKAIRTNHHNNSHHVDKFCNVYLDDVDDKTGDLTINREEFFFQLQEELNGKVSTIRETTLLEDREAQLNLFGQNSVFASHDNLKVAIVPARYGDEVIALTVGIANSKKLYSDQALNGSARNLCTVVSIAFASALVSLRRLADNHKL